MSKKMYDAHTLQVMEQMNAKQEFRAWIIINEFLNLFGYFFTHSTHLYCPPTARITIII